MPKYLCKGSYTIQGAKGLLKEGGSKRRTAIEKAFNKLGGKLEAIYYSLGEDDVYLIVDAPDNASMAALSIAVNAAGGAKVTTIALMTTEEIDAATKKTVDYRPPGK